MGNQRQWAGPTGLTESKCDLFVADLMRGLANFSVAEYHTGYTDDVTRVGLCDG